jgi:hypothetical protein
MTGLYWLIFDGTVWLTADNLNALKLHIYFRRSVIPITAARSAFAYRRDQASVQAGRLT